MRRVTDDENLTESTETEVNLILRKSINRNQRKEFPKQRINTLFRQIIEVYKQIYAYCMDNYWRLGEAWIGVGYLLCT